MGLNRPPKSPGRPLGSKSKTSIIRVSEILANANLNPTQEILKLLQHMEPKDQATIWLHLIKYCEAPVIARVETDLKDIPVIEYKRADNAD